jgi:hypothetical protein
MVNDMSVSLPSEISRLADWMVSRVMARRGPVLEPAATSLGGEGWSHGSGVAPVARSLLREGVRKRGGAVSAASAGMEAPAAVPWSTGDSLAL